MYELKTEQFSGPIEKLLELIEGRKLTVTEVSLAAITGDFLTYLENLEKAEDGNNLDSRLLADFLVVAASLLLIKSKALLPELLLSPEEEESVLDLEERLKAYQIFKPAMGLLKDSWEKNGISFTRPLFFGRPPVFCPADNLNSENILKAIKKIEELIKPAEMERVKVVRTIISLEEKISEIITRLTSVSSRHKFGDFLKDRSRPEIVAVFLAVLHLIERRRVCVEQSGQFSDIMIIKSE